MPSDGNPLLAERERVAGEEMEGKAQWIAEARGAKYEEGLIYYEKGKRMKNPVFLGKAKVIFERLDAGLDFEKLQRESAHLALRPPL